MATNRSSSTTPPETTTTRRAAWGTISVIVCKGLSFVGTQYCVRTLHDPTVLGDTNIRLELLLSTILFVSREGYRLAVPRGHEGTALWTVPTAVLVVALALLWHVSSIHTTDSSDYRLAGILYCIAALMEGVVEPIVLFFLCRVSVAEKAQAEGLASLAKTLTVVGALRYTTLPPVTAFGVAQIAYASIYGFILLLRYLLQKEALDRSVLVHTPTLRLTLWFTLQGLVKFALTEGDRIVLNIVANRYDQGIYALGNAYGGLAARLLLQPLEETARLLFSRFSQPSRVQKDMLQTSYIVLVKAVLYIGLAFACLAVNYTQLLLLLLAGRTWGSNPEAVNVLTAFCYYTAFLAWNGMTEAFVYGVAKDGKQISRIGVGHVATGMVFFVLAPLCIQYFGTIGLVMANCVNMLGRTVFSVFFASGVLEKQTFLSLLRQMLPHPAVLVAFVLSYTITTLSRHRLEEVDSGWFERAIFHIGVGVSCGVVVLSLAFFVERDLKAGFKRLWSGKVD